MNNQYAELYRLPKKLYLAESPVEITAGALLLNKANNKVLVQLKITNLIQRAIIACKVSITCYDSNEEIVDKNFEYQYLNLNAKNGESFGVQAPIYLSNNSIRKFEVKVIEVVFEDGEVWKNKTKKYDELEIQEKLLDVAKDIDIEDIKKSLNEKAEYLPEIKKNIWRCFCGQSNDIDNNECSNCEISKEKIVDFDINEFKKEIIYNKEAENINSVSEINILKLKLINEYNNIITNLKKLNNYKDSKELLKELNYKIEKIDAEYNEIVENITKEINNNNISKIKENYELLKAYQDYKNANEILKRSRDIIDKNNLANTKKFLCIGAILLVLAMVSYAIFGFIIPNNKYKKAVSLYDEGKYEEAYDIFNTIMNYSDSNEWMISVKEKINEKAKEMEYNKAINLYNEGKYEEAYDIFNTIIDYSNSIEWINGIFDKLPTEKQIEKSPLIKNITIKENITSVFFGDIEWIVLDRQGDKVLLTSRYIVDCKPYNNERESVTWEKCTLRKWLNNDFINTHFNEQEKNMILLTDVLNKNNSKYVTIGGNNTNDKIFCLSIDEAKKYFSSDDMRATSGTDYAKTVNNKSLYVSDNGNSWYWLRSPGDYQNYAARVDYVGSVNADGNLVDYGSIGVRPAMWVKYK